ncbi:MAG TPA: CerR family C-terminal domain-containing protein [Afifellaceae bacterium]|nr:CerR family C-terminal domain-containing protein [Afifellaceae bacterium]
MAGDGSSTGGVGKGAKRPGKEQPLARRTVAGGPHTSKTPAAGSEGAPQPRPPTGARSRGADATRERLIDAALDAFGLNGFDGASTRDIARRAGANLAAIPYHFGGKEGLHRAVAQHIVNGVVGKLGPLIDTIEAALRVTPLPRRVAQRLLHRALDRAADTLLGRPEAARWARFIIREQMDPTASFAVLYDGFMGRAHRLITALYAAAAGRDASDPETAVRVFAILGQLLVFRMARGLVEARLGWHGYGPEEVALVKTMLHAHLDALLAAEARP